MFFSFQAFKSVSIDLFVGFLKITEMLIEKGANVNARDFHGDSALILAAAKGKS